MPRSERHPIGQILQSRKIAPWVFLAPFLLTYLTFLVYPFFKGVWISLHDWNLLAVTFDPSAKEYVGLDNYRQVLWGEGITWSPVAHIGYQGTMLGAMLVTWWQYRRGGLSKKLMLPIIALALLVYLLCGFTAGEEGRWFDRRFWPTVSNTVIFVAWTVPGVTITALVLAALLNRESRTMSVLRSLFFLSQVLSVTVVTLIWQIMFSPRQGLIANIIDVSGGTPVNWLTDERFAMAAIVITTIWWSLGIAMMLFLAGLQDISKDIYEAAALDDAKGVRGFFYITLPNIVPTITLVVILQIILHFQVFGQSHLMTNGGPNDSTQVLVRYIYQTAFRDSELGRASAMAVLLFVIMSIFSLAQFLVSRRQS